MNEPRLVLKEELDKAEKEYDDLIKRHRKAFYDDGFMFAYISGLSFCLSGIDIMWVVSGAVLAVLSALSFYRSITWK